MRQEEFRNWLARQGAQFDGGTSHTKVYLNSRQATLPRQFLEELREEARKAIMKQLGLS
ncbi:mRNA interferase [Burkholderia sp. Bp9126]|nr:mRNA interferase [Burkholderia sp. Bp9126]